MLFVPKPFVLIGMHVDHGANQIGRRRRDRDLKFHSFVQNFFIVPMVSNPRLFCFLGSPLLLAGILPKRSCTMPRFQPDGLVALYDNRAYRSAAQESGIRCYRSSESSDRCGIAGILRWRGSVTVIWNRIADD
jgi:hypothetical protein